MVFPPDTVPIIDGDRAYLMMPAEVVCGATVRYYRWSPDGRRVAAVVERERAGKPFFSLMVGGVGSLAKDLTELPSATPILAVGNDGTVIVQEMTLDKIVMSSVSAKGLRLLLTLDGEEPANNDAFVRPSDGRLFVSGEGWVTELGPSGARRIAVKAQGYLGFSPSGSLLLYRGGAKFFAVDLASGKETPLTRARAFDLKSGSPFEAYDGVGRTLTLKFRQPSAKEKKEAKEIEVSREGTQAQPDATKVSFLVKGALVYRPLVKTDLATAQELADEIRRTRVISEAKQAAMAFAIGASDNDGVLPGADWREVLSPYAKNRGILDSFVRTFEGRNLNEVKEPAKTVLGFVSGPGGRAVAYVDGSVRWEPNPR